MSKNKNKQKKLKNKKRKVTNPENTPINPLGGYAGIVKNEYEEPENNGEDF